MRSGEVDGLKWKYVDFDRRLILVREAFVLGEDEYTKTDGSQRDIQMSTPVFEALKRQEKATRGLSDYVFCNKAGKPIDNKNFTERVWRPVLRHLGMPIRRPYQMRHTAATLWLAAGESPEWIARQLGHTSTQMLFKVYSRFVPNLTRQDGSAIDRLLTAALEIEKASRSCTDQGLHQSNWYLPTPQADSLNPHARPAPSGRFQNRARPAVDPHLTSRSPDSCRDFSARKPPRHGMTASEESPLRRSRPKGARHAYSVERPVHFGSVRSPSPSRNQQEAAALVRGVRCVRWRTDGQRRVTQDVACTLRSWRPYAVALH